MAEPQVFIFKDLPPSPNIRDEFIQIIDKSSAITASNGLEIVVDDLGYKHWDYQQYYPPSLHKGRFLIELVIPPKTSFSDYKSGVYKPLNPIPPSEALSAGKLFGGKPLSECLYIVLEQNTFGYFYTRINCFHWFFGLKKVDGFDFWLVRTS